MNAVYSPRVEGARENNLCFPIFIFECMGRGEGDMKGGFGNKKCAVAVHG
jgi:hypothetical protein